MLDPLFTMNSQNQRLIENTQRSSDAVRTQAMKETKEKRRSHVRDLDDLDPDLDDLSGDLLGDMDPDSFGGGSASRFRQMWEDDVEGEETFQQPGDTIFDEGQGTCAIAVSSGGADDVEPDEEPFGQDGQPYEEELGGNELQDAASEQSEPGEEAQEPEQHEAEAGAHEAEESDAEDAPAPNEPQAAGNEASGKEQEKRADSERVAIPTGPSEKPERTIRQETVRVEMPSARDTVQVNAPQEKAPPDNVDKPAAALPDWGISSLLDMSEGFILHESSSEVVEKKKTARKKSAASEKVLSADIGEVLDTIMEGDKESPAWDKLRHLLSRFGKGVLRTCAANKIKVCLLPGGTLGSYPAIRNAENGDKAAGGAFIPETHTLVVDESLFEDAPLGFHPVLYYFAMAWDHALGDEDFASMKSPAVKASFEACRTGMDGHRFPDLMSAVSPVHYFAQAVEAYLSENDCDEPLWSREDLYDFDRSMYSYIEYLFKQGNK